MTSGLPAWAQTGFIWSRGCQRWHLGSWATKGAGRHSSLGDRGRVDAKVALQVADPPGSAEMFHAQGQAAVAHASHSSPAAILVAT